SETSTRSWTASSRPNWWRNTDTWLPASAGRSERNEGSGVRDVEEVGVRSAGQDHRRRPAFDGLQRHRRRAPGEVLRARARRRVGRAGADACRGSRRQSPGQPGDRKLSRGARLMKFGVVVFPGSNCDHAAYHAAHDILGQDDEYLWHKDPSLKGVDVVILPGGFAHGDYLRTGAIARFSPIMPAIREFARAGGPVLGICNGFQVLLEAGMLPGAMLRNRDLKFHCEHVHVRVEQIDTPFTLACLPKQVLRMPIAHGEGNYFTPADELRRLEQNRQIVFRYVNAQGAVTDEANPNGALESIAGICSEQRN